MSSYFDSSALVAAIVAEEVHHARAFRALAEEEEGITSTTINVRHFQVFAPDLAALISLP